MGRGVTKTSMPISVPGMDTMNWRFGHSLELPRGLGKPALRQGMGLVPCQY